MKTLLAAFIFGAFVNTAHAQELVRVQNPGSNLTTQTSQKFTIPTEDRRTLEKTIYAKLIKETGFFKLEKFQVDWRPQTMKCMKVVSEMGLDEQLGLCTVRVAAWQVQAEASIVKTMHGYSVEIIYANVD